MEVMNDKVKEVSLVREQTQDSFDGFEELYKPGREDSMSH